MWWFSDQKLQIFTSSRLCPLSSRPPQGLGPPRGHDQPGPVRLGLLPHPPSAAGLLPEGRDVGLPRLAVQSLCVWVLREPVLQVPAGTPQGAVFVSVSLCCGVRTKGRCRPQHPAVHAAERAALEGRGGAHAAQHGGADQTDGGALPARLGLRGGVLRALPVQRRRGEVRLQSFTLTEVNCWKRLRLVQ